MLGKSKRGEKGGCAVLVGNHQRCVSGVLTTSDERSEEKDGARRVTPGRRENPSAAGKESRSLRRARLVVFPVKRAFRVCRRLTA